jgi:DNA-binding SARP family transcriptional activator
LPVSELDAHPALKFYLGVGQAYIQPELGRSTLEQAVEAFSTWPSMDMEIMATVAIITVYVHAYSRWERMDPWADRLVALLADSSRTASAPVRERGLTVLLFARAYCSADRQVLVGLAAQGRKILEQGSDINSRLDAASQLINAYGWIGDLAQEEAIVALAQPLLNDAQAQPWLRIGWYTHAARYWWVGRADHARAAQTLRRGLEVAEETGLTALNGYLHALLFNVHIDEGDLAAAAALGASIEDRQAAGQRYAPAMVLPGKALLALLQGDGVSARIHALAGVAAADDWGSTTQRAMACFLLVIVLVATGDREEARARLDAYQAAQRRIPGLMDDYLQLLLRAYLAIERQETQHGDELLGCALAMARKQGYINHLYWYPPMMSALYARALRCGIETDFVIQVIRKRSLRPVSNGIENWPWPLKIHTLGRFEILKDDKALVFGRKTPTRLIELLRAILAFGGREVATARLIDVVWPDQDGDSAAEALQVSLHRLRKLIGNHTIAVRDGRIFLDPNQVWVDAWAFEQWVEDFAEDRARGRERLLELSERALALYRGAFLGAEVDAPWALGTRERLRIKFVALVCGLGKGLVDAGAVEEALHHHLRALDADDQAEEIYQGALRCYRQLNRRAEAQALYRRLRATLAVNFGVEPAPATEALLQEPFRP